MTPQTRGGARRVVELVRDALTEAAPALAAEADLTTLAVVLLVLAGVPSGLGADLVATVEGAAGTLRTYPQAQRLLGWVRNNVPRWQPGARVDKPELAAALEEAGLENLMAAMSMPQFDQIRQAAWASLSAQGAVPMADVAGPPNILDDPLDYGPPNVLDYEPGPEVSAGGGLEGLDSSEILKAVDRAVGTLTGSVTDILRTYPGNGGSTQRPPSRKPPTRDPEQSDPPASPPPGPPAPPPQTSKSNVGTYLLVGALGLAIVTGLALLSRREPSSGAGALDDGEALDILDPGATVPPRRVARASLFDLDERPAPPRALLLPGGLP